MAISVIAGVPPGGGKRGSALPGAMDGMDTAH